MIDEMLILKEIDEWTDILNRNIERLNQVSSNLMEVCLLERELATYQRVKNLIKEKCTPEAATPEGADINSLTQVHYSTDQKKSEIRELAVEIFDLCLQLQENADGTIDWREKGVPCVHFSFYGSTSGLQVKIWKDGFDMERRPDFSYGTLLDVRNGAGVLIACRETLIELLEERRWNDNGKDDPDHN